MQTSYIFKSESESKAESIINRIEECFTGLSEKRRIHTENVIEEAIKLARHYGEDEIKAAFAAKCHDFFRGKDNQEINSLIRHYGLPEKYLDNPNLAHGKIAEAFLREELGIDDQEILNAVSFHTTGRCNMSLLEKIVFIADAIEPNRKYSGVEEIRKAAYQDIDKACLMSLEGTINHLKEIGAEIDKIDRDTIEAASFLKAVEKEK